jgi:hypothetical protein
LLEALSSSSILEPVVLLDQRTGSQYSLSSIRTAIQWPDRHTDRNDAAASAAPAGAPPYSR